MRSHAKASTAGPTQCQARRLRLHYARFSSLAALALLALLLAAAPALGGTVTNDRPLLFSFDGSDTTAGAFTRPMRVAVDYSTGNVYVLNTAGGFGQGPGPFESQRVVAKFNSAGEAEAFAATGKSSLDGSALPGGAFGAAGGFDVFSAFTDIAIDNSAVNPGRLYVSEGGGPVHAFDPEGNHLWTLPQATISPQGIAVDAAGHLWVSSNEGGGKISKFANTGSPPALEQQFSFTSGNQSPTSLAIDKGGSSLYVSSQFTLGSGPFGIHKYNAETGAFSSDLTPARARAVAVDQSVAAGHVFGVTGGGFDGETSFVEFDDTGAAVAGAPFGADLIRGVGMAYNPTKDWVYIADIGSKTVKVFGPKASGTVPDVAIGATDAVGLYTATAHGTVNPQNVPNSYHLEWKVGTGSNWATAQSSPLPYPSIEPTDSSPHPVSLPLAGLKSATTYQVRLVGTNTENGLNSYSTPDTFTTDVPPPPGVSIDTISAITVDSAHIEATIASPNEEATWMVETSTSPTCSGSFAQEPLQTIPPAPGSTAIEWDLDGLVPAEHYCVRITVTNAGGTTISAVEEFNTLAIPPEDARTAFAGPRTDTTARLNGRVDPQGAPLTYSFEYSKDGGANWIDLPDGEDTREAREQVVVATELTGLTPNTTYHYRFSVENAAGEAVTQGAVEAFTTRTSAEVQLPQRGIELVNNPDKGNQRINALGIPIRRTSAMSVDGERVVWSVLGGAPGGNAGTGATFLAKRTASGWQSSSLVPPAADQVGGGLFTYALLATTPDFSKFLFRVASPTTLAFPDDPVAVAVDESGHQETLKAYKALNFLIDEPDVSDDGAHVLIEDPASHQLEDVGGGVPEVVSLMPGGAPADCLLADNVKPDQWQPDYHVMSTTDGSRVYFQARPNGSCGGSTPHGLYVRNRESTVTTLIDPGSSGESPELVRATPDGRAAYFSSPSQLDPDDSNSGMDVYRWDEASGGSSCLTCEVAADAHADGGVMVSDDFSRVYFESEEQLIPGLGELGHRNVYVLSDGELGFVADPGTADVLRRFPKLSADGKALLFRAPASQRLTVDEVETSCSNAEDGKAQPCFELYRYDDRDASLECVSCRYGGTTSESTGSEEGITDADYRLSADGSTVLFVTPEALVRLDVNRDRDLYEWRNGTRRLITDGVSSQARGLSRPMALAADEDGSDLLFAMVPPPGGLTGFELDGQANIYDARIGGGFEPPASPVHCKEDSCQGPLVAPPAPPPASSSSFSGRGNLAPPVRKRRPCARKRGKAKQRCVRKQKRRAQKARANHNAGRGK